MRAGSWSLCWHSQSPCRLDQSAKPNDFSFPSFSSNLLLIGLLPCTCLLLISAFLATGSSFWVTTFCSLLQHLHHSSIPTCCYVLLLRYSTLRLQFWMICWLKLLLVEGWIASRHPPFYLMMAEYLWVWCLPWWLMLSSVPLNFAPFSHVETCLDS